MTTESPYDAQVHRARIAAEMHFDSTAPRISEPTAILRAGRMIAEALLAVAESNRPQPPQVNVTVTEAVVERVQEVAK